MNLSIPFSFAFILLFHLSYSSTQPYTPKDEIFLNCGSSGTSNSDRRKWLGDNSNSPKSYISVESQQNSSSVELQDEGSVPKVPYLSLRFSAKEFTYNFPVTQGPKFIRLHFFPTTDNETFIRSFFTVKAGPYTLLSNFSAWLHMQAEHRDSRTLMKEFLVNVQDDQKLSLTFIPNKSSFAFINGVEVVSCPDFLYYTAPNTTGPSLYDSHEKHPVENNLAIETVVRLNVGGEPDIPDTGMFRDWKKDDDYFKILQTPVLPFNHTMELSFDKAPSFTPRYAAPEPVYKTARSMSRDREVNKGYNLTWLIPVDLGFYYMLRLHFCELYPNVTDDYPRRFIIYIEHQEAESLADVRLWAGDMGVPVYRDYAVLMGKAQDSTETKKNLTIELHPANYWQNGYFDALLNGIELFKLSNNENLAGPNPDGILLSQPQKNSSQYHAGRSKNLWLIVGLVIGGSMLIAVIIMLVLWRRRWNPNIDNATSTDGASKWTSPFNYSSTKTRDSVKSTLPSDLCRHFSLWEIKAATNNFDDVHIIGRGGFGNVYKGLIDGGTTTVAIKRLRSESKQGVREFMMEIEMLSQLRHVHLVSLIGYCDDDGEMILVYEYMSQGTLRDHLYNTSNPPLSWKQRLEICLSAAQGLHYLHTGTKHMIIHRDVKTTNILIDEKWVAKVSDFGLSRLGSTSVRKAHVSTTVKGTVGYIDPEYTKRHQLTEKSDVYSFGVVLFEVLCARPPINQKLKDKVQVNLSNWARKCCDNGTLGHIIDPHLKGEITPSCLKKYGDIAVSCLNDDGMQRPSMDDVVWGLKFVLELHQNSKDHIYRAPPPLDGSYEGFTSSGGASKTSVGEGISSSGTNECDVLFSGLSAFSEIANPTER